MDYSVLVASDGCVLAQVPVAERTRQLCFTAVEQNGIALEFVPREHQNKQICLTAILSNPMALAFMPREFTTAKICEYAVAKNGAALQYVPGDICTPKMCADAMNQRRAYSAFVPTDLLREVEVVHTERKRGIRGFIDKYYDAPRQKFVALEGRHIYDPQTDEAIGSDQIVSAFEDFDSFYRYVGGNLTRADLLGYDFSSIRLKDYRISGAGIAARYLIAQGLYDQDYYDNRVKRYSAYVNADSPFAERQREQARVPLRLIPFNRRIKDSKKTETYYLLSHACLNHRLLPVFSEAASEGEIAVFIRRLVDDFVDPVGDDRKDCMLLIDGNVSYDIEIARVFYSALCRKWNPRNMVAILGTQQMWGVTQAALGQEEGAKSEDFVHRLPGEPETANQVVDGYRSMLTDLRVSFLENDLFIKDSRGEAIITEQEILDMDRHALWSRLVNSRLAVLGGLGFPGDEPELRLSTQTGVMRNLVEAVALWRKNRFGAVLNKLEACADDQALIVFTHEPDFRGVKGPEAWEFVWADVKLDI